MTATPEPAHQGLRPLSPHGEGYCRVCRFVVGLTATGSLEVHGRGASLYDDTKRTCPGSGKRPPKVTPYSSRKAAFRSVVPPSLCHVCKLEVPTTRRGGARVYARHLTGDRKLLCPASERLVPPS